MEKITFQITDKEKTQFLIELLSHFDFVENIMINGKTVEKLPKEIKELLKQRVENYIKAPEKVKTWDEVEQRLIKKYNYEI